MTSLVTVPPKVDPLAFPTLADKPAGTYNLKAYNWAERIPQVVNAMNAQAIATYNNAIVGAEQATAIENGAIAAQQSASQALASANSASSSKDAAATSANNALNSANSAANTNVSFQSRMLGVKNSEPTADNFGQPLAQGAIYINANNNSWNWWDGSSWKIGLTDPDITVVDFANVTNKPNTLAGYGITDAMKPSDVTWSAVNGKPADYAGLGWTFVQESGKSVLLTTNQSVAGNKTWTGNTTFSGTVTANSTTTLAGAKFGNAVGANTTDLSKHIDLYGGVYGISVSNARQNYLAGSGASHVMMVNNSDVGNFSASGLAVAGNITASGAITGSGNVTAYSDVRLKERMEVITEALAKVHALEGFTFTRKDTGQRQTGVLAQQVQAVLPEAVEVTDTPEEYLSVAYGNLAGLLIEAIKELDNKLEAALGA